MMPSLKQHQENKFVKTLYIGDSGTGKTGSLTSLVKAGYKLRVLDLDNGIDTLAQYCQEECPELLANVEFESVRDKYKASPAGPIIAGMPKAYVNALNL